MGVECGYIFGCGNVEVFQDVLDMVIEGFFDFVLGVGCFFVCIVQVFFYVVVLVWCVVGLFMVVGFEGFVFFDQCVEYVVVFGLCMFECVQFGQLDLVG